MPQITLTEAIDATTNWRSFNSTNTINSGALISEYLPNAFTIDGEELKKILAEENCVNVRVYFGYSSTNPEPSPEGSYPMQVVFVGVDANGQDMVSGGYIYDRYNPCPGNSSCDSTSPLA